MIRFNVKRGIIKRYAMNIIFIAFIAIEIMYFNTYSRTIFHRKPSFADIYVGFFKGEYPASMFHADNINFPAPWFTYYLLTSLYTALFPYEELHNSAARVLLRVRSRRKWFGGILIYILFANLAAFIFLVLSSIISSGGFGLGIPYDCIWPVRVRGVSGLRGIYLLLIPLIAQLLLSTITTIIFLKLGVVKGTVILMIYLILCVYFDSPLLFPTRSMIMRYNY